MSRKSQNLIMSSQSRALNDSKKSSNLVIDTWGVDANKNYEASKSPRSKKKPSSPTRRNVLSRTTLASRIGTTDFNLDDDIFLSTPKSHSPSN